MKIPAIKKLIEANYTLEMLDEAEIAIINEEEPQIEVEGDDDGEQLTHLFAAKWILEDMQERAVDFKSSLRAYTEKVRNSIS
ncbi:MAG: hypothetical protein H6579_08735 [Chitinophagales bacterium]|nr:hypothetical protein [Chitinophagales bacterium]